MSKEKQIEEMAKISCNTNNSEIKWECAECPFNTVCDIQISCEALYNAGYRKQIELTPCDCCRFNPPSSGDGKPCSVCPAQAKMKGGK